MLQPAQVWPEATAGKRVSPAASRSARRNRIPLLYPRWRPSSINIVTVRRAFAFVILAVFLAGPASRLECLLSCGGVGEVAERTESCHSDKSDGPAFGAGMDHCDGDALPVAVVAKRGEVRSQLSLVAPVAAPLSMAPRAALGSVAPPRASSAPSLTAFLVPLRI